MMTTDGPDRVPERLAARPFRRLRAVVRLAEVAGLVGGTILFPAAALSDPPGHDDDRHRDHGGDRRELDRRGRPQDDRREGNKDDRREGSNSDRRDQREDRRDHHGDESPYPVAAPPSVRPSQPISMPPTFRAEPRGPMPGQAAAPAMRGDPVAPTVTRSIAAPPMRGAAPTAPRAFHPRFAPPPPIVERPPARPGFVWVGGYYDWDDDRYVWINGRYVQERPDVFWRPPRWELQGGVFGWLPGAWISIQSQPQVAPPPPPPETVVEVRPGFAWVPGFYEWRGNQYVWASGRWERDRPDERWTPGHWERRGKHWSWHQGGWHRHR